MLEIGTKKLSIAKSMKAGKNIEKYKMKLRVYEGKSQGRRTYQLLEGLLRPQIEYVQVPPHSYRLESNNIRWATNETERPYEMLVSWRFGERRQLLCGHHEVEPRPGRATGNGYAADLVHPSRGRI